jgi:hypothetical protein
VSRCLALLVAGLLLAPASASAERPPSGRLIVRGFQQAWLVPARGPIVPLPAAAALDWSPALGLLAVTNEGTLTMRTATGTTLWARDHPQLLGAPRWSSAAPARLAFLAGRSLRVVDAEGAHELRLGRARDVAPAWRPGHDELALVRPDGDLVLLSGTGRPLARWHPGRTPVSLSWTGDGAHLVVSLRYSVVVLGAGLEPQWSRRSASILSAVAAPAGTLFALLTVRLRADGSQVTTLELRDAEKPGLRRRLARTSVLLGRIVWSPAARYVVVERPLRREWLLVNVRTGRARGLALPRDLRPIFDGVVSWFR